MKKNVGDEQKKLKAILEAVPLGMLIIDENMIIKHINDSFFSILDKNSIKTDNENLESLFNCKNCAEVENNYVFDDCKIMKSLREAILYSKPIQNLEVKRLFISGNKQKYRYFRINIVPLLLDEKKHAILVVNDITEHRELEENMSRYQLLSQNANDIILFADMNGLIIEANNAAVRAYGYEKEEFLNKSIFYLVNPDPTSPVEVQPFQANTNGIYYEATAFRKDGTTFTAEVSMQGTEIGNNKVLMAIMRDVTEKKLINKELKRAKELAEAANIAKSKFLANMSHEIRTPLNGMIGMIDLTLLTDLTEEQKDNLYTAKESANTLLNLINDILDFSKIEAGKLSIEHIDFSIRELLDQAVKPHIIRAKEKGLTLKHEFDNKIPQVINGDPYRLKQIIDNLLGNAIKFTELGEVKLSVELIFKNDDYVELELQIFDTGIGMTSQEMEKLFYSFSQVDSSHTRKYGGTGLGLAISKSLIDMMNGSIWVNSIKGKGSTFGFNLKLGKGNNSNLTEKKEISINKAENPLRILLVEDDRINQLITTRMIEEIGHKAITASNGKEALQTLDEEAVDVIIMDIQMPEMDGIEATKRIRIKEKLTGKHVPIIALTAYALQGDREKFLSIGMDGYISKPMQLNDFLNTLEEITKDVAKKQPRKAKHKESLNEYENNKFMSDYYKSMKPLLKAIEENINNLKYSFENNELFDVERYSHHIKKSSLRISATELKNAVFKIELAARKGNIVEASKYLDTVLKEFSKIKKQIENYEEG